MTQLTYVDVLHRLTDVTRLAQPPLPGEAAGTWTSYDRRSHYDASQARYVDWDANDDGTGYIRMEDDMYVVFEQQGPGVMWRVWSAYADQGHIQIFIDGAEIPVVDMPFRDFFERHPANHNPLGITNLPELTPTLSRGRNRFIPIPYQHSCKVRFAPGWGLYYHFTYYTFAPDVRVPSYTGTLSPSEWIALAQIDRELHDRGSRQSSTAHTDLCRVTIPAQTDALVWQGVGNRVIDAFEVLLADGALAANPTWLRQVQLQIWWDDDDFASVDTPLGDFFGCVGGIHAYRTLPMGVTAAAMYAHWSMPFAKRARVVLVNQGDQSVTLTLQVRHTALECDASQLLRFHAKWHRGEFHERSIAAGRPIDWPLLHATGPGRFVGVHLHVENTWPVPDADPVSWWYGHWDQKTIDWWWGEGDEKFFVDGEVFPSTFGTGSEDYIGYAWAAEPPFPTFASAYAAQIQVPIDGNGHTSVCRFHIGDDVPFQHSFEACIEKYKPDTWGEQHRCLYDCVAFWYQQAGTADAYSVTQRVTL